MSESGEVIEGKLNEAIGGVLREGEGAMVTKWCALVEVVDVNGERGLWTFAAEGMKSWDTLGLLQQGIHEEAAQTVIDRMRDGDD